MSAAAKKATCSKILQNFPGGKTTWKAGRPAFGWYPMPDEWWNHMPRLQRGLHQRMLIEYVWAATVPRDSSSPFPDWSPWLSWAEIADWFRCSPDQLRDDARDAAKRGLMAVEEARGRVRFQVLWQRWPNLKDYTPPLPREVPKKEQAKPSSHWFGRRRVVAPGETWDFTVPDLPADFQLQKISFRNTGSDEPVAIVGGGPAEGGVLVLETEGGKEKSASVKSKTSREKRESTPQNQASSQAKKSGSPLPNCSPDLLQQICDAIGTYGPVTREAVARLLRFAHATPEQVLECLGVIRPPENAANPVGWLLAMIPKYFTGEYKPSRNRDKISERDARALAVMRGRGDKIA